MFWTVLAGYLVGWLLVNLIVSRVLARATRNAERLEALKTAGHEAIARAVVKEITPSLPRVKVTVDKYPFEDGDVLVLGPEIFVSADRKMICWRGEHYDWHAD